MENGITKVMPFVRFQKYPIFRLYMITAAFLCRRLGSGYLSVPARIFSRRMKKFFQEPFSSRICHVQLPKSGNFGNRTPAFTSALPLAVMPSSSTV